MEEYNNKFKNNELSHRKINLKYIKAKGHGLFGLAEGIGVEVLNKLVGTIVTVRTVKPVFTVREKTSMANNSIFFNAMNINSFQFLVTIRMLVS